MKHLNLTEGFNPFGTKNTTIDFESFTFNGGEPHIKLKGLTSLAKEVLISIRINSFNDLGLLAVAVDALRRRSNDETVEIGLFLPYFPGARQDRVCNQGEALTVKVYADMINNMNFKFVDIFDPHSDVTPALLNNCNVINNHEFVRESLSIISDNDGRYNPIVISPDAGANKKIKNLAGYLHNLDGESEITVVKCDKTRETSTGNIAGFEVYADNLDGKDCIIVDDICDGGGTFIGLAEELKKKNAGDLYLIVSHGIFSKGFHNGLSEHFKHIYCTDSFDVDDPRFVTAIKFEEIL